MHYKSTTPVRKHKLKLKNKVIEHLPRKRFKCIVDFKLVSEVSKGRVKHRSCLIIAKNCQVFSQKTLS